jgi:hypothetical protein
VLKGKSTNGTQVDSGGQLGTGLTTSEVDAMPPARRPVANKPKPGGARGIPTTSLPDDLVADGLSLQSHAPLAHNPERDSVRG